MSGVRRMWVNQPSTMQPMHDRHGQLVIAHHDYDDQWRCFPIAGNTVSFMANRLWLSDGWPRHLQDEQTVRNHHALQS